MADSILICVGNAARGDDGAGPAVANQIRQTRPDVNLKESAGDPYELLELFTGVDGAVVVDAVISGDHPPGAVFTLSAGDSPVPTTAQASTHGVGLAEAIELARSLGRLPDRVVVVGIEAADLRPGAGLTPAVAAAVPAAAVHALAELNNA